MRAFWGVGRIRAFGEFEDCGIFVRVGTEVRLIMAKQLFLTIIALLILL